LSVQMASILALSLAAGRFLAGQLVKKFHWTKLLTVCLLLAMGIVAFVLPRALDYQAAPVHSFGDIPMIGFVFPLIGLFIAPVYPLIASATLSALPQKMHSAMTGLIVIFSALGGTLGSRIIGMLFEHVGGAKAFYFMIIPISLLIIALWLLNKFIKDYENAHQQA
ncbi:MAG: MFS transporter, partial [Neisseria sp.]|nr:MFS transporter [Neisseria sp.]